MFGGKQVQDKSMYDASIPELEKRITEEKASEKKRKLLAQKQKENNEVKKEEREKQRISWCRDAPIETRLFRFLFELHEQNISNPAFGREDKQRPIILKKLCDEYNIDIKKLFKK